MASPGRGEAYGQMDREGSVQQHWARRRKERSPKRVDSCTCRPFSGATAKKRGAEKSASGRGAAPGGEGQGGGLVSVGY